MRRSATNTMTETIRAMQLYQHTTEFILEDGPEVSIDREEGVKLRLGPQSSVHTLGERLCTRSTTDRTNG